MGNTWQKMSRRASGGVERPRQQQGEEEDAQPAPLHLTAHPTLPLPLLSVAQSFRCMCVLVQAHGMSPAHGERLRVVGCALTGKLVRLLTLGTGCHLEPDRNRRACHKLMHFMVGRVVAKLMHSLAAAVGNKLGKEAEELCASGQCAAAVVLLKSAVDFGHLPSRALMANLMIDGRQGVAQERWSV